VLRPVCCNTTREEVLAALEEISTAITGATPARNGLGLTKSYKNAGLQKGKVESKQSRMDRRSCLFFCECSLRVVSCLMRGDGERRGGVECGWMTVVTLEKRRLTHRVRPPRVTGVGVDKN
jgi:hypothetical protein